MHLTRIFKNLILFTTVFLHFTGSVYADGRDFSFKINNTKIDVRTPDGFYESSYIIPGRLDMTRTLYPDSLKVHALLLPKGASDYERIKRYFIFASSKKLDKRKSSKKFFRDIREMFREQQFTLLNEHRDEFDKAIKEGALRLTNENDIEYRFQLRETTPLGVFDENENYISSNAITKLSSSVDGMNDDFLQTATMSIIFLKNKILYVYGYSDFDSEKDIIWIEAKTKELMSLLLNNN